MKKLNEGWVQERVHMCWLGLWWRGSWKGVLDARTADDFRTRHFENHFNIYQIQMGVLTWCDLKGIPTSYHRLPTFVTAVKSQVWVQTRSSIKGPPGKVKVGKERELKTAASILLVTTSIRRQRRTTFQPRLRCQSGWQDRQAEVGGTICCIIL